MIEIIEPSDGSQQEMDGKLYVMCDCDFFDRCGQGKVMGSNRCVILMKASRLACFEVKKLKESKR